VFREQRIDDRRHRDGEHADGQFHEPVRVEKKRRLTLVDREGKQARNIDVDLVNRRAEQAGRHEPRISRTRSERPRSKRGRQPSRISATAGTIILKNPRATTPPHYLAADLTACCFHISRVRMSGGGARVRR